MCEKHHDQSELNPAELGQPPAICKVVPKKTHPASKLAAAAALTTTEEDEDDKETENTKRKIDDNNASDTTIIIKTKKLRISISRESVGAYLDEDPLIFDHHDEVDDHDEDEVDDEVDDKVDDDDDDDKNLFIII